jgi:hypothetical protein
MDTSLVRTQRCDQCGEPMLWTQNAWIAGGAHAAAYQCPNGHAVDPAWTRQCPKCGVHDTTLIETEPGRQQFKCYRCGESFENPR